MKNANIVGFLTAFSIMVTAVFKFNHFTGAGAALCFTGLLLGIYFPVFIIAKMQERSGGQTLPAHVAAAMCASLTDLGITFRLQHWPGASILLVLGLAGFSLLFIPLLLVQKSKEGESKIMNGIGAIGISAFGLGILFKLQHWPGAAILLALSPLLLFLVYFPMYIMNKTINNDTKSKYLMNSFFAIVIGTLLGLYFMKSIEIHDMDNKAKVNGTTENSGSSDNSI